MNLNEYQKQAKEYSKVELNSHPLSFAILGLGISGESGEVSDLIKKFFRDLQGVPTEEWNEKIIEELGDTLWYIALIAEQSGHTLQDVAQTNINKLKKIREERGI